MVLKVRKIVIVSKRLSWCLGLVLFSLFVFPSLSQASRFRGGTLSVAKVDRGGKVTYNLDLYFKRSFFCLPTENCLNKSYALGTFFYGDGKSSNVRPVVYMDDKANDILRMRQIFVHSYNVSSSSRSYTASWKECCWIPNQASKQNFTLSTTVLLSNLTSDGAYSYSGSMEYKGCTNAPFSGSITARRSAGGLGSGWKYTLVSPPPGLTINSTTGKLSWSTPQAGVWPVGIRAGTGNYVLIYRDFLVNVSNRCPNTAPKIAVVPSTVTVKPGQKACTKVSASDVNPLDKIEFSVVPAKIGATAPPIGKQANPFSFTYCWTPVSRDEGITHKIDFTVRDTGFPNLTGTAAFLVRVLREVNPVITLSPSGDTKSVNEGSTLTFSADASDPDKNGIASFSASGFPNFCTRTQPSTSRLSFVCKPTFSDGPKTYKFTLRTTDKDYTPKTVTKEVTIIVRNVNRPPKFGSIPSEILLDENRLFTYKIQASDPDSDPLTFRATGLPSGATLTPDGTLRWLPLQKDVGVHSFTAYVRDDKGLEVKATIRLRVRNVNDKPSIGSLPPKDATEDKVYSYKVVATDQDPADQGNLTYKLKQGSPNAKIDSKTGQITWTPDDKDVNAREITFEVEVCDTQGACVTQTWKVTVRNVNDKPSISTKPPTTAVEDKPYSYTVGGKDPDPNDQSRLIYKLLKSPKGAKIDSKTGKVSWTPGDDDVKKGEVEFEVEVCDVRGACTTQKWKVKVSNVNDAPSFVSTPPATATQGQSYEYVPRAVDPDPGDDQLKLKYTLVKGPKGTTVDPATGKVSWKPTNADAGKEVEVEIQVCDPNNACTRQKWKVKVKNFNDPPKITSTPPTEANPGEDLNYQAKATDPDPKDVLEWKLKSGPRGASVDATTGKVSWKPGLTDVGKQFRFEIEVCDNGQPPSCVQQTFTVTVKRRCVYDKDCPVGQLCLRTGQATACVPAGCHTKTPKCPAGEYCKGGKCIGLCKNKTCPTDTTCRPSDGKCIRSCSSVKCPIGQRCVDGQCENDPCKSLQCQPDEFCDDSIPARPRCVKKSCTSNKDCRFGRLCMKGACVEDPCNAMSCPSPQDRCVLGQCVSRAACVVDIHCPNDQVCIDKLCYPPGCYIKKPQCGKDNLCVKTQCQKDSCLPGGGKQCAGDEFCRATDGRCVSACATVNCAKGKICREGACIDDPCLNVKCSAGETCAQGVCEPDYCYSGTSCKHGRVCNPDFNRCQDDLCRGVTCPDKAHVCYFGQCVQPRKCTTDNQCARGTICLKGECRRPECLVNTECDEGEICLQGACVQDPCQRKECPQGEFCRLGQCISSCASVTCGKGKRCVEGRCITDLCAGVTCPSGEQCKDGKCLKSTCTASSCSKGRICRFGECVPDPCLNVQCAKGQKCVNGGCIGEALCDGTDAKCPTGSVCVDGSCVTGGCYIDGCAKGKICIDGECVDGACSAKKCSRDEICNPVLNRCVKLCPRCPTGQVCVDGKCAIDPCEEVQCAADEVCVRGACKPNACKDTTSASCRYKRSCREGFCADDPCKGVTCPKDFVCRAGTCFDTRIPKEPDEKEIVPEDAGPEPEPVDVPEAPDGCSGCSVNDVTTTPFFLFFLFFGALAIRRRRRR